MAVPTGEEATDRYGDAIKQPSPREPRNLEFQRISLEGTLGLTALLASQHHAQAWSR